MNAYEMTFILRPDLDEEATRAALDGVTGRLQTSGGDVLATFLWNPARRRMAYPIKDFGDGYYVTTTFRIAPDAMRGVENALKLNTNVLRFLLVQATETNIAHAKRMEQMAATAAAAPPAPAQAGVSQAEAPAAAASEAMETIEQPTAPARNAEAAAPAQGPAPDVEGAPEPVATAANPTPFEQTEE